MSTETSTKREEPRLLRLGFTEILLSGVILLIVTLIGAAMIFYVTGSEDLEVPELQPVIRIASEEDFPVGSSRVRNWGEEIILVVRADSSRYVAVQGISPVDGCILRWDRDASRIHSPCRYAVYDLRGDAVAGLSNEALQKFAVSVRDGVVYVSRGAR